MRYRRRRNVDRVETVEAACYVVHCQGTQLKQKEDTQKGEGCKLVSSTLKTPKIEEDGVEMQRQMENRDLPSTKNAF